MIPQTPPTNAPSIIPQELYASELSSPVELEEKIMKNVIIATTTSYPSIDGKMSPDNELRAKLTKTMISFAVAFDYAVVVVDRNSDEGWKSDVKELGATIVPEDPKQEGMHGMGKARRQALELAVNYSPSRCIVAWTEPEKYPYIFTMKQARSPLAMTATPIWNAEADIVVPRRMDELASYPLQQRLSELHGNVNVMDIMRAHLASVGKPESCAPYLDLWVGPRTMNAAGVEKFLSYKGTIPRVEETPSRTTITTPQMDRWESIFVPVWSAMVTGCNVRGVAVPYTHPAQQTRFESGVRDDGSIDYAVRSSYDAKRDDQLSTLVSTARRFTDSLKISS